MGQCLEGLHLFNKDLDNWDTSKVTNGAIHLMVHLNSTKI